ncbi:hypothetical protein HNQ51_001427 [Inhella inkyongensis]|uniref:TonB C-terminal domain-containing protein n=1 Tax=Inhella inkyongensis TaxID=392593 RepID=A0A840S5Q0_9BURK|nr:hypothetical protein [Inhella inkyongensis]MBB5204134.1 hypothetical protein [Inhella inkyongensis]
MRSLDALRLHVARCVVEANPEQAYLSQPPAVLLAVPVFKLELHSDGRVKRIDLLREPGQAKDTVQLARKAIERAAPFGDLRRVPGPLVFTETYLFDDARRFKPRSLN